MIALLLLFGAAVGALFRVWEVDRDETAGIEDAPAVEVFLETLHFGDREETR